MAGDSAEETGGTPADPAGGEHRTQPDPTVGSALAVRLAQPVAQAEHQRGHHPGQVGGRRQDQHPACAVARAAAGAGDASYAGSEAGELDDAQQPVRSIRRLCRRTIAEVRYVRVGSPVILDHQRLTDSE
ncbi:hypothetical protein OG792_05815 [Micromonospora sp. NBC_01699]|uniref:hypothetical protein n=1 Tax=Micromonospora sp. NBC_01699 TaxID=2975984 RepID=UPI002E35E10B|nr:hypothetical protein [Micromonospora sp. NBC_01699]